MQLINFDHLTIVEIKRKRENTSNGWYGRWLRDISNKGSMISLLVSRVSICLVVWALGHSLACQCHYLLHFFRGKIIKHNHLSSIKDCQRSRFRLLFHRLETTVDHYKKQEHLLSMQSWWFIALLHTKRDLTWELIKQTQQHTLTYSQKLEALIGKDKQAPKRRNPQQKGSFGSRWWETTPWSLEVDTMLQKKNLWNTEDQQFVYKTSTEHTCYSSVIYSHFHTIYSFFSLSILSEKYP